MRLTTRYLQSDNYFTDEISEDATEEEQIKYWRSIVNKLGQLEDVEDDLDIDLLTLFKALKNGIYVKTEEGIKETYTTLSYIENSMICGFVLDVLQQMCVKIKDYGKTWALTKEEL